MPLLLKTGAICKWNAVDVVRRDDAVLEYGIVINTAENGLIIDFDCPGRRSEFVGYDKIFESQKRNDYYDEYESCGPFSLLDVALLRSDQAFQVLARASTSQPWTWHPAKFLYFDYLFQSRYAFVEVQCVSGVCRQLVNAYSVRIGPSADDLHQRSIGADHFRIQSYSLPDTIDGRSNPLPLWKLCLHTLCSWPCNIYPLHLLPATLFAISGLKSKSFNSEELVRELVCAKNDMERRIASGWTFNASIGGWISPNDRHASKTGDPNSTPNPVDPNEALSVLPVEILENLLQYVDSYEQVKYRRVSALWNAVLTQPSNFREIRVSFLSSHTEVVFNAGTRRSVMVGRTLQHCLSTITQRIIITNAFEGNISNDIADCLGFLAGLSQMQRQPPKKRLTVIFNRFAWEIPWNVNVALDWVVKTFSSAAPVIEILRFTNSKYLMILGYLNEERSFSGVLNLNPSFSVLALWDLLETSVPVMDSSLTVLSQWIQKTTVDGNPWSRNAIKEILTTCQSNDPREGIHYRLTDWDADALRRLDICKLTKLTLYALHRLMISFRHESLDVAELDGRIYHTKELQDNDVNGKSITVHANTVECSRRCARRRFWPRIRNGHKHCSRWPHYRLRLPRSTCPFCGVREGLRKPEMERLLRRRRRARPIFAGGYCIEVP
ncbi:uncharacterized protein LOC129597373 isoform X2 [Paramacrobiotus metropolitanus]|uniref:uncharacterized protein LOC129597373 isoform X2 n=1 Tax=Paramacrobiotus metropolitanus TaxID=2943436 RepID=UPI0024460178|nr:uncharacterized protein LOC129597373 isoform X2 [Paramacrobiotus metropolitanus]